MPLPNIDCPAPLGRTLLSSQRSLPGLGSSPRVTLLGRPGRACTPGPRPAGRAAAGAARAGQRPALTLVKHIEMAPKTTNAADGGWFKAAERPPDRNYSRAKFRPEVPISALIYAQ